MNSSLKVKDLHVHFASRLGDVKALSGIDLEIHPGEILGIVGESGCGKSTLAKALIKLLPSYGVQIKGEVHFEGKELLKCTEQELRSIRGKEIGFIFQDPMTSLNPTMKIGDQVIEGYLKHNPHVPRKEALSYAIEMLTIVGIPQASERVFEYPHTLSGGMRQRVMIAMALACNPKILIADEPTTALDVTIQAQILDLMIKLKEEFGSAVILITHDLGIIADTAKNVVIMYAGKIVETADVKTIFANPLHPYTQGLLKSVPRVDKAAENHKVKRRLHEIHGIVPSLYNLPKGCYFHPRCPFVMDICREKEPELKSVSDGHSASCWMVS